MSIVEVPGAIIKRVSGTFTRIFGTRNDRIIKRLRPIADSAEALEPEIRALSDEQLRERADELRSKIQAQVTEFEADYRRASREERRLREKEHRKVLKRFDRQIAEQFFAEATALVREASRRAQKHRHFHCQIMGGYVLYDGSIAEMKTGEGKTIVCHVAAFMKVLQGKKVHVITANDYLVRRDAEFAQPIFAMLGATVGYIQSQVDPGGREGVRRAAYECDITFGTNSEFGFDYLRDNMKRSAADQVQSSLDYAIIDEVDSLLIDEARTPLIISGPTGDDITRYPRANKVAADMVRAQHKHDRVLADVVRNYDGDDRNIQKLGDAMRILGWKGTPSEQAKDEATPDKQTAAVDDSDATGKGLGALGPDFLTDDQTEAIQFYQQSVMQAPPEKIYRRLFIVQRDRKQVGITHDGVTFAQDALDMGSLYSGANVEWPHLLENALRAHKVYDRDKDYVVQGGDVVIVDQFTGRLMPGRQWSDGLHQAVEAKESVRVKEETQTLATITVQNYAHLYDKVAGMTGTALTEADEFMKIYQLDVVAVPTNRPVNRPDHNDKVFRDVAEKYDSIVDEIHEMRRRGRPSDPFVIAEALQALRVIKHRAGEDVSRIDSAIEQFNKAEFGDRKVVNFMLEVYDEQMGDLSVGRPVLVGTTSVENSEKLSKLLERTYGIDHEVLNAKNHAREAEIVAKAGQTTVPERGDKRPLGNVTIATNMAGRGTDIKLGEGVVYPKCRVPVDGSYTDNGGAPGAVASLPVLEHQLYPPGATKCCIHCEEYDPSTNCAHCFKPKLDPRFPEIGRKVCPISTPCGLHIVGTERHESRRIDNQLRGRAGRQGDPGSSRFFLSLEDDLLKLFMPDWMLKMLGKHGFETEGMSLEMKQLSKGIERAQRKVEERNFGTRKNLLEWDEPMDYQRKNFYDARQDVLEGHNLRNLILDMIGRSIEDAVHKYLAGSYSADCIADWCREDLQVQIDASEFSSLDPDRVQDSIRNAARDEAHDNIRRSIGEYIDEEAPPSAWDLGGLQEMAQRAYKVSITQNQLRKMQPDEIQDTLMEAADEFYERINLDGIVKFTSPEYPVSALREWLRSQFNLDVAAEDIDTEQPGQVVDKIQSLVQEKYAQREVTYPVDYTIARAVAVAGNNSAMVAQQIVNWANLKYGANWKLEDLDGKELKQVREMLVALNREALEGDRLEKEVDDAIAGKNGELGEWAKVRFGPAWSEKYFKRFADEPREALLDMGRQMMRWELGQIEHRVILQLYDQAWKDHLLEMDRLESAIKQRPLGGDQTHPQSQFAIEGRDLFDQMWARLRERIVGVILKIQPGPPPAQGGGAAGAGTLTGPEDGGPATPEMQFRHADATGAGFSGAADQAAAMRAQGGQQKVETIRREKPKVGRNDPCPCGSGKKYKQCHGK